MTTMDFSSERVAGFKTASKIAKFIFLVEILGILLFVLGFPTSYWWKVGDDHSGLWWYKGFHVTVFVPEYILVVRALCFMGIFFAASTFLLVCMSIFVTRFHKSKMVLLLGLLASLAAGVAMLIAITVYGVKINKKMSDLYFSFWLTGVSGVIFLLCAGLLIVERN